MLQPTLNPLVPESETAPLRRASADAPADLVLIERARAGDEHAVALLVRRHSRRLFRAARSVLEDDELAAAAVVEAVVAALASPGRIEPPGRPATSLLRLALAEAHRTQAATSAADGAAEPAAATEPERQTLEQEIAALPAAFRAVYMLRVVEGLRGVEIAAALGLHTTTVRTRLYRALRRLPEGTTARIRSAALLLYVPPPAEALVTRVLERRRHASIAMISASPP